MRKTLDLAGQELEILHQISRSISCSLDLDQVLKEIVELVVAVTKCDSCLLYLLEDSEPYLFLRASKNPHPRLIGRISVKVGEGITGWVAETSETVAIARNAGKDPRFKVFNNLPEDKYQAFLSVPIIVPTDQVIGVINVQHRKAHRHSDHEQTLLSIIGHQVGGAISNARLYEEAERRTLQLSTLVQVSQIAASGRYLDKMLQLIANMISETMQAKVCSIMLVDQKKERTGSQGREVFESGILEATKSEDRKEPDLTCGQGREGVDGQGRNPRKTLSLSGACEEGGRSVAGFGPDDPQGVCDRRHQRLFRQGAGFFEGRHACTLDGL